MTANDSTTARLDPITFAVIRHGFAAAAEDMCRAFKRTAMLPILYEFNDFGMSIFDEELNMIADAPGLPIFVGSLDGCIEKTVAGIGGADQLEPGDVLINNHPYLTAGQPADLAVMAPIFACDTLIGYAALRGHMGDMGAQGPYPTDSYEIFQEGTVIPPAKLYAAGVLNEVIPAIIAANSRLPGETVGSVLAAAGALGAATRKMTALVERYGLPAYRAAVAEVLDHGERMARAALERIPDGEYVVEEYMDDNGRTDEPVLIRCAVRVEGSDLTVDLTGSAPEQLAAINCPWGYTLTTVRFALKRMSTPDLPANGGQFRPLKLIAPSGSLFNPNEPAGCFIGAWSSIRLGDMVVRALSQALPDEVPASNGGDLVQVLAYVRDPDDHKRISFFAELGALGHGGWAGGDGMNALIHPIEAGSENLPTELVESRMPVIKRRYELITDSGGPGRHRGGVAAETEIEFRGPGIVVVCAERTRAEQVYGVAGGHAAPARNTVVMFPGTPAEVQVGKRELRIEPGDRAIVRPAGGGGYGDPLERDPDAVARDVREGYVSAAAAASIYRVELDAAGGLDAEATARSRTAAATTTEDQR